MEDKASKGLDPFINSLKSLSKRQAMILIVSGASLLVVLALMAIFLPKIVDADGNQPAANPDGFVKALNDGYDVNVEEFFDAQEFTVACPGMTQERTKRMLGWDIPVLPENEGQPGDNRNWLVTKYDGNVYTYEFDRNNELDFCSSGLTLGPYDSRGIQFSKDASGALKFTRIDPETGANLNPSTKTSNAPIVE